ncbi:hypothetical protein FCI23_13535 [Actinacidiphila oryziradicis]|uniref:Uncharacterized protein n=1 Tax=Actinacidiphila oryziradicis TaxID=2571141 RepID=A0A4U0T8L6_9ACTN|nr:hypothetical protein FCI23_13535 [Actinacidiphila oryziradicis]
MTYAGPAGPRSSATRTGGVPLAPAGFLWPRCAKSSWVQGDETPSCPLCARPMGFVARVEEGHDHRTAANFGGGGCGYAFVCASCGQGAFRWQC